MRSDTSIQPDQRWPKTQAIMDSTRSQIKPLLTADQQQKYERMTTRRPPPGMNGGPGGNAGQTPPSAPPQ